jgi:thioredoxin 1
MILLSILLVIFVVCCNSFRINNRVCYRRNSVLKGANIQDIFTADELDAITTKNTSPEPVIIDYQKSKCKPCMKVAPLFEDLAKKYEGRARFYKVDADSSPEALSVMKANGIRSVPTFHIWRLGTRIDSIQGAHVDEVEALIEGELQKMK